MLHWLLTLDIEHGPVPWAVWGASSLAAIVLVVRAPSRRRVIRAGIGIVGGGAIGFLLVLGLDLGNAFGAPLPSPVLWWAAAGFAAWGLAIASLWDSTWWRRIVAAVLVAASALSMTVGVNAAFGLDRTPAELLGIQALPQAGTFPPPVAVDPAAPPLAGRWTPPADMPAASVALALSGDAAIPSSAGFAPRDGSIYLPPAAQVADPPALPVIVQMMGLPGFPTSSEVLAELDAFAAAHHGLGPIIVVVDQLGAVGQNPGCADSARYGGVATYVNVDVPAWIRANLRVLPDPRYWTISGYSNGGACSFLYGAEHPGIWGNVIDTSGEEWPGFDDPRGVTAGAFAGDAAAFEANKPESVLLRNPGAYADRWAVFTAGAEDTTYGPGAKKAAEAAAAAGFEVAYEIIPGVSHTGRALSEGLAIAFDHLAVRWGLAE